MVGGVVLIQSFEPLPELEGRDGVLPCEPVLAQRLVDERRAEVINPRAEAFRYCPGSRAYEAMRASRGQAGPIVLEQAAVAQVPQAEALPVKRPRGRPRKVIKAAA